jgi:hypothetical protein
MLHLISSFIFSVWIWYFDFHKINDIYFIWKKEIKFKILNSRNNGYIYSICNIIKPFFVFGVHQVLVIFLKCSKWKFKKRPTSHILSFSIWKWEFAEMLIYHILMVIAPKKTCLWYDNYQISHMVHKFIVIIWNHNV